MQHKVLEIVNPEGLKARPAALFVQTASLFQSQILVEKGNKKINAKSIMGVLSLAVGPKEIIHVTASGEDEKEAVAALAAAVRNGLKEEYEALGL